MRTKRVFPDSFLAAGLLLAVATAGCDPTPPDVQTRIVEVPSSKPYRFIEWSMEDRPELRRAIRAHNRAHQTVIDVELRTAGTPTAADAPQRRQKLSPSSMVKLQEPQGESDMGRHCTPVSGARSIAEIAAGSSSRAIASWPAAVAWMASGRMYPSAIGSPRPSGPLYAR